MRKLMLAALSSGSGKTVIAAALSLALQEKGLSVRAFKCGPDYIDPMFHEIALGKPCRHLDLFLSGKETVRGLLDNAAKDSDFALCEGVMGFYDGLGGTTTKASTWEVADTADIPVVLVVQAKGTSVTLAAQIAGLVGFRKNSHICGVLLNQCTHAMFEMLAPMLERETGLVVLGYVPYLPQAEIESRHLGLRAAGEIDNLQKRLAEIAQVLEETVDIEHLLALSGEHQLTEISEKAPLECNPAVRIAVARDEAFCFYYEENLEALRRQGAELVFFSPLNDAVLPKDCAGLYLGGGYPELYAERLEQNDAMRSEIARAAKNGLPIIAECGGFLYLGKSLESPEGKSYAMCGVLNGSGQKGTRPVRFGYALLTAQTDGLLCQKGQTFPIHSFHYWDSTENGADFTAEKPIGTRKWRYGIHQKRLYAGFGHLYFPGIPGAAERFVTAAKEYQNDRIRNISGGDFFSQ